MSQWRHWSGVTTRTEPGRSEQRDHARDGGRGRVRCSTPCRHDRRAPPIQHRLAQSARSRPLLSRFTTGSRLVNALPGFAYAPLPLRNAVSHFSPCRRDTGAAVRASPPGLDEAAAIPAPPPPPIPAAQATPRLDTQAAAPPRASLPALQPPRARRPYPLHPRPRAPSSSRPLQLPRSPQGGRERRRRGHADGEGDRVGRRRRCAAGAPPCLLLHLARAAPDRRRLPARRASPLRQAPAGRAQRRRVPTRRGN
jgi:hypothetical protein